jgi:hypothetical protein
MILKEIPYKEFAGGGITFFQKDFWKNILCIGLF